MVRPPYTVCLRLIGLAESNWDEIEGHATLRGVDLMALPLYRWCNVILAWYLERVEDREQFMFKLTSPAPGEAKKVTQADVDNEMAMFRSFAAAAGARSG